jgi:hypothetical protein
MAVFATARRSLPDTTNRVEIHSALPFESAQGLPGFGLHHGQQVAYVNVAIELGRIR